LFFHISWANPIGQIQNNTLLSTTLHIYQDKNETEGGKAQTKSWRKSLFGLLSTRLGDKFTFQQDNNQKHMAKYTLELLTKITLNVPEWSSHSFDLNRLENLWQVFKMAV
jgi:hypothetical protein